MIPVRQFREDECLFMVTRRGTVKKTELTAFKRPLGRGIIALGLEENDQLIGVARVKAGDHVILSTREGMSIRFDESRVRSMGRQAYGVKGIDLLDGDEVVGMIVANGDEDPASILTVCARGYGKRTLLTEYRTPEPRRQGPDRHPDVRPQRAGRRRGQGHRRRRDHADHQRRPGHPHRVGEIRTIGRNTQGVRLIKLDEGDTVSSLARLPEEELGPTSRPRGARADRRRPAGGRRQRRRRRSTGPTSSTTAWPRPRPATISKGRSSSQ